MPPTGSSCCRLTAEPGSIGRFNVGTEGTPQYVTFATGNLQYQAITKTWRFAEPQWDIIGANPGNTTYSNRATQTAWIDLFRFGATGLAYKLDQSTLYMPSDLTLAIPTGTAQIYLYDHTKNALTSNDAIRQVLKFNFPLFFGQDSEPTLTVLPKN